MRCVDLHITTQQGRRSQNEDVEEYFLNINEKGKPIDDNLAPIDFFLICDGHGGKEVAKFVAPLLKREFTNKKLIYPISDNDVNKIFNSIQTEILKDDKNIGYDCGTTALIIVRYIKRINNEKNTEHIQVINLGDCRAVLSRNNMAIALTNDHKPCHQYEMNRINNINNKFVMEENIGSVKRITFHDGEFRVNGLSVSRAFGDIESCPQVTHIPEISDHELLNGDNFIIMACDGLWDVMENQGAVDFIKDHIDGKSYKYFVGGLYPTHSVSQTKCLARKIATYAIALGSTDNISVMVIIFNN